MNRKLAACASALVGRTIAHVVVKAGANPAEQLFLVFDDGTFYEIFTVTGTFMGAGELGAGGLETVRRYLAGSHRTLVEA